MQHINYNHDEIIHFLANAQYICSFRNSIPVEICLNMVLSWVSLGRLVILVHLSSAPYIFLINQISAYLDNLLLLFF